MLVKDERLVDMWARMKMALQGLKNFIGSMAFPTFDKLLVRMTNLLVITRRYLEANPQLIQQFKDTAVAVIAVGAALIGLGTGIKIASGLLSPGGILFTGVAIACVLSVAFD